MGVWPIRARDRSYLYSNIQLSPEGEVNSGGYIPRREGSRYISTSLHRPWGVVQKLDNAIHRINHYPLDIAIGFAITYPVDSDLSGG